MRLFVPVDPTDAVRAALARAQATLRDAAPKARVDASATRTGSSASLRHQGRTTLEGAANGSAALLLVER